jgi:hypothetical protein
LHTEADIERMVKRLVKDNGWDKINALSFMHDKYQIENRIEEAAIVDKLMSREQKKHEADTVRVKLSEYRSLLDFVKLIESLKGRKRRTIGSQK